MQLHEPKSQSSYMRNKQKQRVTAVTRKGREKQGVRAVTRKEEKNR